MTTMKLTKYTRAIKDILRIISAGLARSVPGLWFTHLKERLGSILFLLWIGGCSFWVYQLATISATPRANWINLTDSPREALIYLSFGAFGLIFSLVFASYLTKFIYNILHDGIQSLFSSNTFSAVKSLIFTIVLIFAFSYIKDIKSAGLTAYNQVNQLVYTSRQHEIIVEKKARGFLDFLDQRDRK